MINTAVAKPISHHVMHKMIGSLLQVPLTIGMHLISNNTTVCVL